MSSPDDAPPKKRQRHDKRIGEIIDGRYELLERIGSGAMGTVYRARQLKVDRDVAVKVLRSELSEDEELARRFENEARVLSQLRHPGTIRLFDFGSTPEGSLYFVCELLKGRPLLDEPAPHELLRTLKMLRQICDALAEAHAQGIVHRDLKPSNVFIETVAAQEFVKVLDFGIARLGGGTSSLRTATGLVMGTPAYMSPEQAEGRSVDARSDLYSLGVIAYERLSGAVPFTSDSPLGLMVKHLSELPTPLSERAPHVPKDVADLVMRLLAKDPADRPQSAVALAAELVELERKHGASPASLPPPPLAAAAASTGVAPITEAAFQTDAAAVPPRPTASKEARAPGSIAAVAGLVALGAMGGAWLLFGDRAPAPVAGPKAEAPFPEEAAEDLGTPETVEPAAEPALDRAERPGPQAPRTRRGGRAPLVRPERKAQVAAAPTARADTQAPVVRLLRPEDGETAAATETVEIVADVIDDGPMRSVALLWGDDRRPCPGSGGGWSCAQLGRTYAWRVQIDRSLRRYKVEALDQAGNTGVSEERTLILRVRATPAADHGALIRELAQRGLGFEDLRRISPENAGHWAAWRAGRLKLSPEEALELQTSLIQAAKGARIDRALLEAKAARVAAAIEAHGQRRQGAAAKLGALRDRFEKVKARLEQAGQGELSKIARLLNELELDTELAD